MRRTILALILTLGSAVPTLAATHYQTLDDPRTSSYFGHVSLCEIRGDDLDPRVVREGKAESASVNVPLSPGDRLLTSEGRRCEIEFDTGTVVQLDGASGVRLETVLASSLSSERRLTNLVLEAGRVRIRYLDYGRSEVFQVLTANAAIKLDRSAVVEVTATEEGETRLVVESGRAAVLFGPSERKVHRQSLKAGKSLSVRQDRAFAGVPPPVSDAFAHWTLTRDRERTLPPASGRPLSATIRGLSPVVVDFADRLSRTHGEWVWTSLKEHAWRPHLNKDAGWRPYTRGRWTAVKGQPFWVAEEPWGWVPYHLGYWYEDDAAGWVWLPGSTFAPAWVTWTGCGDALAWWPFGPQDWLRLRRRGAPPAPSCEGMGYAWYGYPWSTDRLDPSPRPVEYAKRRSGSGPEPSPPPRPRPERPTLPRELRLMSEQLDRLALRLEPAEPERDARPVPRPEVPHSWVVGPRERVEAEAELGTRGRGEAGAHDPLPVAEPRFRDWNPDVRVALERGVSIRYDSELNRVVCEGCRERGGGGFDFSGSGPSGGSGGGDGGSTGSGGAVSAGAGPGGSGGSAKSGPIDR